MLPIKGTILLRSLIELGRARPKSPFIAGRGRTTLGVWRGCYEFSY
jgi:hypothetical protein